MKTQSVAVAAILGAFAIAIQSTPAAQFQPTTGGNLDDGSNWNNTTDNTFAVRKTQSGPLTISADNATLPNANATLQYDAAVTFTNAWTAGWTLNLASALSIQKGATLVQTSGTLASTASGSGIKTGGTLVADGAGAALTLAALTLANDGDNRLVVRNGATLTITSSMTVNSGASVSIENATFSHDTTSDNKIIVNDGASLRVKGSTMTFTGNKGRLYADGGTAVFDGAVIEFGQSSTAQFGGNGGTIRFEGSPSSINHRFTMVGDGLEFCVSNTAVSFAPASANELFITGSGTSDEDMAKTLRFCGAAPRLAVASSNGFHLRGKKGITLLFDMGSDGFPTDAAVVEITAGGSFKGDKATCAASLVVVNVDDHCPPATYTLLQGKGATTFLTGENKWVANCGTQRKAIFQTAGTAGSADECLRIVIKDTSLATVLTIR